MSYIEVTTPSKKMDFDDIYNNCWSGAEYTAEAIANAGKAEEFMWLLHENFGDQVDETTLNDFMRIENNYIFECLGITGEKDKEEEA